MYNSIQACRAVAALLVVLFHIGGVFAKEKYFGGFANPLQTVVSFGGPAGVAFFFVLSGFIIDHIHRNDFNRPDKLRAYVLKRVIRIYPTYIVIFMSVFMMALLTPSLRDTVPHNFLIILKSLALIPQDPAVVGRTGAPVIDAAWTLQYEMVFYAAIAALIVNRWIFFALLGLFFANFALQSTLAEHEFPASFFANELILLFGMGVFASRVSKLNLRIKWPACIAVVAFALLICVGVMNANAVTHFSKAILNIIYGALSGVVIVAIIQDEVVNKARYKNLILIEIGNSSYALYLLNFPIISLLTKAALVIGAKGYLGVLVSLLFVLAACIVAGVVFHRKIEVPIMRYLIGISLPYKGRKYS
jgi:exopolysaccharide production protein ExoZ